MKVSFYITKKIVLNKQKAFSNFIIQLSIAAVAISTCVMVIAISFINGFQGAIQNKAYSFWGHIRVEKFNRQELELDHEKQNDVNVKSADLNDFFNSIKEIDFVQQYAQKFGVIMANKSMEGLVFKGYNKISSVSDFIIKGRWVNFKIYKDSLLNTQNYELVMSDYMAKRLNIDTGSLVISNFVEQNKTQRKRKLKIVGIYETGIEEYDKNFVFTDIAFIQKMNLWSPQQIDGYELVLKNPEQINKVNKFLFQKLSNEWNTQSTKEIVPALFDWLELLNVNKWVLIIILSIVALINMIACMVTFVLERSRMIGILKTFGYSNFAIQKIFIYYASYVSFKGIFIGMLCGVGICLLQQYFGFIVLDEHVYFVHFAPIKIIPTQILSLIISAFVVCFLILILPSYFIQRFKPIRSIQIQS